MNQVARRTASAVIGVMVTMAVATGPALASTAGKSIPAPKGLPKFYEVPTPLPSKAGTLIKSEKMDAAGVDGTAYRVMYTSKGVDGKSVAVTGVIVVPNTPAPDGGYPVLSWAHGTNGMADQCAASLDSVDAPAANQLLARGWLVAATDYRGEGTPGLHPYIAGTAAARDTIDIVRAADQLKGVTTSKDYVVWGHSQGGHTAMNNLRIGDSYAPELHLKGVVAGAPPSQFALIYNFLKTSRFKHYLLMAAGGLNAYYGDKRAPLDEVLKPAGIALLPVLDQGCSDFVAQQLANVNIDDTSTGDPFKVPKWKKILEIEDPETFKKASPEPLLIIHGGNDEQIPVVSSQLLTDHLCEIGQGLERWVYPNQSHAGVIGPSLNDMIHWIDARFTGSEKPGAYAPVGQADVQVTGCPK